MIVVVFVQKYFAATNISRSLSEDFFSFVQLYFCILPSNISRSLSEDFFSFVELYLCIFPPPIFLTVFQRISSLLCRAAPARLSNLSGLSRGRAGARRNF